MTTLDDLPGVHCSHACNLLRLIREHSPRTMKSAAYQQAAADLAKLGYADAFAHDGVVSVRCVPARKK